MTDEKIFDFIIKIAINLQNENNELRRKLKEVQEYSGMSEDESPLQKEFGEKSGYDKLIEKLQNQINRQDKWLKRKTELITNMQNSIVYHKTIKNGMLKKANKKYTDLKEKYDKLIELLKKKFNYCHLQHDNTFYAIHTHHFEELENFLIEQGDIDRYELRW